MSLTSVKEYFIPDGTQDVVELLEKYEDSALIVAGGSFVRGLDARDLLVGIEALIDLQQVGLNEIDAASGGLGIGAMTTFAELQQFAQIQTSAAFGAVRDALEYPPLQIRNVATVGGNIASACPYFDLPTAALALDGVVNAQGPNGSREIELQVFMAGLFENALEPGEFVTGLFLPKPSPKTSSAFIKFETNANDLAIVNVAVRVTLDDSNACREARVVIGGGVDETPVRASASENRLQGNTMTDELLEEASAAARADLQPMSDHRASGAFRAVLAETLTRRALRKALARIE